MTKMTPSLLLAILPVLCLHVAPAQAQLSRTAVSAAKGSDANNCDVATPCRTFQKAHDQTNTNGEITVLDAGGYGAVNITKSISIVNDGAGEASILVSGNAAGITVNVPAGFVNLRGITIQGIGFGNTTGMDVGAVGFLTITNSFIRNHVAQGILFRPAGSATLVVSNTTIADNGGTAIDATGSAGGTKRIVLDRVNLLNNHGTGLNVAGGTFAGGVYNATVTDSVAAHNDSVGFNGNTGASGSPVNIMITRSVAANNGIGVRAIGGSSGPQATVRIGQSTITGNGQSWVQGTNGVLRSYGDNNVDGNGDAPEPVQTLISKK